MSDDTVIAALAAANPVREPVTEDAQGRAEAHRILARVLSSPPPPRPGPAPGRPRRWSALALVTSVLVVLAVAGAILLAGGRGNGRQQAAAGGSRLVLQVRPAQRAPRVTDAALAREVRQSIDQLGVAPGTGVAAGTFHIAMAGHDRLLVTIAGVSAVGRDRVLMQLRSAGQLDFYDWEADVLLPNGEPVAQGLRARAPEAILISRGVRVGPGGADAGGLSLYRAVRLASTRPVELWRGPLSRTGPQYWMFGALGSSACAAAASADGGHGSAVAAGDGHCVLSGPAGSIAALDQGLPPGVAPSAGEALAVPQGTVVLGAVGSRGTPPARFFVLNDEVMLDRAAIADPHVGVDTGGEPDVRFNFTPTGRTEFQKLTATIAHRGRNLSTGGEMLPQHFAVAFDGQLLTIPEIGFHYYPDGVNVGSADITGGLNKGSAAALAAELQLQKVPLAVSVVGG
ncbi:MAG: SecDF P1 head subdomain-containing protein [Solirubrobacteraceae bacterium]